MRLRTAIIVAALVPLASVGLAVLPGTASERWAELVAWADKAQQAWVMRDFRRAPAAGDVAAGRAFAHYADALAQVDVLGRVDARLLAELRLGGGAVAGSAADEFALRWRPALTAMRMGAHCTDARPDVDWEAGMSVPTHLLQGRDLVQAANVEVRRLLARGDGTAAVNLLLDTATFATDLQRSPLLIDQVIAGSLLQVTMGEVLGAAALEQLDDAALAVLAEGLAVVDAQAAQTCEYAGEVLMLARTLIRIETASAGEQAASGVEQKRTWRFGWSRRWAAAEAVLTEAAASERLTRGSRLPWPERERLLRDLEAELARDPNELVRQFAGQITNAELVVRRAATQVRLLRLAACYRAGRELPELGDPLGAGTLAVERSAQCATFRSAGGAAGMPLERRVAAR